MTNHLKATFVALFGISLGIASVISLQKWCPKEAAMLHMEAGRWMHDSYSPTGDVSPTERIAHQLKIDKG